MASDCNTWLMDVAEELAITCFDDSVDIDTSGVCEASELVC
jgi:hypothetical protein